MAEVERWEAIGEELRGLLSTAPARRQRAAAAAAAIVAAERTGLDAEPVPAALVALRAGRIDAGLRQRLSELADVLDEAGFAIRERVDDGLADESEYHRLFCRARAATALTMAMRDDPRNAALEGIYEAYHAVDGDEDAVADAVLSALDRVE